MTIKTAPTKEETKEKIEVEIFSKNTYVIYKKMFDLLTSTDSSVKKIKSIPKLHQSINVLAQEKEIAELETSMSTILTKEIIIDDKIVRKFLEISTAILKNKQAMKNVKKYYFYMSIVKYPSIANHVRFATKILESNALSMCKIKNGKVHLKFMQTRRRQHARKGLRKYFKFLETTPLAQAMLESPCNNIQALRRHMKSTSITHSTTVNIPKREQYICNSLMHMRDFMKKPSAILTTENFQSQFYLNITNVGRKNSDLIVKYYNNYKDTYSTEIAKCISRIGHFAAIR
ncbi:MAG: hypothetical protein COC15_01420 [Legionellales bacterium]|nr:MAG: hypothetical protein COC15_01420 [Legionellales bacterium]